MNPLEIYETFEQPAFVAPLTWLNPPQTWQINNGCLRIEPDAKTDFWQQTHYGFVADNGHFLYAEVAGDFVMTTKVSFKPKHQYDQAGLMVRLSPHCWLKTSVEYEPEGPAKLGAVVTNHGYSDWSTQNFISSKNELKLRVRREGRDYMIEYSGVNNRETSTDQWTQIRLAPLLADDGRSPVKCGLYACSPIGAGYVAEFDFLKIEAGRMA